MANLKQGDVVQLKSGGPAMTVEEVTPEGVHCTWFKGPDQQRGTFPAATLVAPVTLDPGSIR